MKFDVKIFVSVARLEIGQSFTQGGDRGGLVVECRTPEREVGGSIPTAAVLCP